MTWLTVRPTRNHATREVDQMFDNFFTFPTRCHTPESGFRPRVDVIENDNEIGLTMEAPGVDKNDIKVTIKDRVLTIEGNRTVKRDDEGTNYIVSEISSGSFSRSFTLPETVDTEKIKADFNNGLLDIRLSKLEEVKPKEIEVSIK